MSMTQNLRKAIALGKERGIQTAAWEQKLEQLLQAQEVAKRTKQLLATQGWCLWACNTLNKDIIVVTRNELIDGYPQRYSVYTQAELELLSNTGAATKLLVHEAKKITRAILVGVTDAKQRSG